MLVLSRQRTEAVEIEVPSSAGPRRITVTIEDVRGDRVRLGFDADKDITMHRLEVARAIRNGEPRPFKVQA